MVKSVRWFAISPAFRPPVDRGGNALLVITCGGTDDASHSRDGNVDGLRGFRADFAVHFEGMRLLKIRDRGVGGTAEIAQSFEAVTQSRQRELNGAHDLVLVAHAQNPAPDQGCNAGLRRRYAPSGRRRRDRPRHGRPAGHLTGNSPVDRVRSFGTNLAVDFEAMGGLKIPYGGFRCRAEETRALEGIPETRESSLGGADHRPLVVEAQDRATHQGRDRG